MDLATLVTAVLTALTALGGWLRERRGSKAKLRAKDAACQRRLELAAERYCRAEERLEEKRKLILHIYESLEGVQRQFDRDSLMSAIRRHSALKGAPDSPR